jgi:hypothetical protein
MLDFTDFVGDFKAHQKFNCDRPIFLPFAGIGCVKQCPLW